jgi:hypothetical protein
MAIIDRIGQEARPKNRRKGMKRLSGGVDIGKDFRHMIKENMASNLYC